MVLLSLQKKKKKTQTAVLETLRFLRVGVQVKCESLGHESKPELVKSEIYESACYESHFVYESDFVKSSPVHRRSQGGGPPQLKFHQ